MKLSKLSMKYGAPMGRRSEVLDLDEPRSIRLAEIKLDRGGYDSEGAYWGFGQPLYAAEQGGRHSFVRADTRLAAVAALQIPYKALKVPPKAAWLKLISFEKKGTLGAAGIQLIQELEELGFGEQT